MGAKLIVKGLFISKDGCQGLASFFNTPLVFKDRNIAFPRKDVLAQTN